MKKTIWKKNSESYIEDRKKELFKILDKMNNHIDLLYEQTIIFSKTKALNSIETIIEKINEIEYDQMSYDNNKIEIERYSKMDNEDINETSIKKNTNLNNLINDIYFENI